MTNQINMERGWKKKNKQLNEGLMPFGFVDKEDLEMCLGKSNRGRLSLPLYRFDGFGIKETGKYLDVSGYKVIARKKFSEIIGQLPEDFSVFESREADGERREAKIEDAELKADSSLQKLVCKNYKPRAVAAVVVRDYLYPSGDYEASVQDTIYYMGKRK